LNEFESAFTYSAIGMAVVSPEGRWLRVNDSLVEMLGYESDEFLKTTFQDITYPEDLKKDMKLVDEMLKGLRKTYVMDKRYLKKNKEVIWARLSVSLVKDSDGKPKHFISQIENIDEIKKAELALKQNSIFFNKVLETIYDGYWDWKITEDYEYMSPRFWTMLGHDPDSKKHHPSEWQKIIFQEDLAQTKENLEKHIQTGGAHPFSQEVRYNHKDGTTVWILCRGKVIEWAEDGSPIRMIGTHTDITRLKDAERALGRSSKFAALGAMASGISHEINNPLTIISTTSDWLGRKIKKGEVEPDKFLEKVDTLNRTVKRVSEIIDSLSMYSRTSDQSQKVTCTLSDIVESTLPLCKERLKTKGISFDVENLVASKFQVNRTQIAQVLLNLIYNSIDSVKELGSERWIKLKGNESENFVELYVIDSGVGISSRIEDRIFEPFFTTKAVGSGMGLGLSVSAEIMKSNDSELKYCKGADCTTFQLSFPKL
jgi:PAS domain S-box-containing protein